MPRLSVEGAIGIAFGVILFILDKMGIGGKPLYLGLFVLAAVLCMDSVIRSNWATTRAQKILGGGGTAFFYLVFGAWIFLRPHLVSTPEVVKKEPSSTIPAVAPEKPSVSPLANNPSKQKRSKTNQKPNKVESPKIETSPAVQSPGTTDETNTVVDSVHVNVQHHAPKDAVTTEVTRPSTPPQIQINSAPNGIVNAAPNLGSQTINNVPPSRVLSTQQLTAFTAALSKVKGTLRVVQASSSDDVFELSGQLCTAAQNAKWANACSKSRNSGMGTEVVAKGLECYSENWGADDAIAFQDAMKAAQLTCIYFPRAYNTGSPVQYFGTRGVTILIGSPSQN